MRFNYSPLNAVAIAIAVGLATWTLSPMFSGPGFLTWVPALLGISAVIGAAGALIRFPRLVTLLVQILGMAGLLLWIGFRQAPSPETADAPFYEPLVLLGGVGTAVVRESSTPLPSNAGLHWLLLCIIALVVVATELLVNALEQPAWSLAPLGVVYGVGAVTLPNELHWTAFAAISLGYGLILLSSIHLVGTGTNRLPYQATRFVVVFLTLAVAATVAPVLTPLVPLGDKQPWLQAGGNDPIQLSDPSVALSENLRRPGEQVVLRYSTDSDTPVYLRTVALELLTVDGAKLTALTLASNGLEGADTSPGRTVETKVQMLLPSEYLPVPYAVDTFRAGGDWAYDADTMSIIATGDNRTEQTAGLEYTATSTVPDPDRETLAAAEAGTPSGEDTLSVPEGLDAGVAALTDSITAQATTAGEKALAIQSYLRSEKFEYSLDAPITPGLDVISNFLLNDNSGYCIHFAAGMIAMARLEGIPARMAIGYTPGERDGDDWIVTTHNMHSWPELYFEGLGWVPFEPTKSVASPPGYTDPDTGGNPNAPSATPSASAAPSAPPSASAAPSAEPSTPPEATDETSTGVSPLVWLSLLAVLILLVLPVLIRMVAAAWRLRSGQESAAAAEGAWREVRATFIDVGLEWSDASPLLAAEELTTAEGPSALSESTSTQLVTLASTVERSRYARDGADTSAMTGQVRDIRRSLLASRSRGQRVRTLLLPRSLKPSHKVG